MRAARWTSKDAALVVTDVPDPTPGPDDVLVAIMACGICSSDLHLMDGSLRSSLDVVTPGHEAAGTIVEVGRDVRDFAPGDHVIIAGGRPCGECAACRTARSHRCLNFKIMGFDYDGGWAEYVAAPAALLTRAPANVPIEQAAILADAVATPYAGLVHRARLSAAQSVGIWGIGGLGVHAVRIARMIGAYPVVAIDPLPAARRRALEAGADLAIDPQDDDLRERIREATGGLGLDLAVDVVGSNAVLAQAVSCLAPRGTALMIGLTWDPLQLGPAVALGVRRQSIIGHLGYDKHHLDEVADLVAAGRLDVSATVTATVGLTDVETGIRMLASKDSAPVRIVVKP